MEEVLDKIAERGKVECNFCDYVVHGDEAREMLRDLGEHGKEAHPDLAAEFF